MEIKINTHGHDMPYQAAGGDWIDLYTAEETVMKAGDFRLISLGVSMEIPEGYEAIVAPRSSTPGRMGKERGRRMTLEHAIRLARQWAFGGVCTVKEGEAQEYHKMALAALEEKREREEHNG